MTRLVSITLLGLIYVLCASAQSGVNWLPFSVSEQAVVSTDFSNLAVERFYVKLPCEGSVWFKLFLRRADGANSHVELYSKVKGNIYCNAAGARNWYDGEKTDFTMEDGAMKCESGDKNIILVVEKTADRVTIKNKGQVLYNKAFSDNDANCRQATTTVKTQVWNYDDSLGLAVFDNSAPLNLVSQGSCFVQDFDYQGADIKKITNVDSADSCLAMCGKQAGCLSMTYYGTDCWLKNLMYGQNPAPKVGCVSANLACQGAMLMNNNCVKTNFDFWGADIKKVSGVSSVMDCVEEARKTQDAKSVAFVKVNGDCWVKYSENGARPEDNDRVDSVALSCLDGVAAQVSSGNDCVDEGVDYWGADIKNVNPIYTIEECEALCYVEDSCVSLTHRPSTQDCWLKSKPNGENGKSAQDTVNSINLSCFLVNSVEEGCVKESYDFRGADIKRVDNVVSIEDCSALCADQAGCVSVTHQPSTSRCWLKNKEFGADPQDMAGVNSRNLKCGDVWCMHLGSFLYSYASRTKYVNLEDAQKACVENDACKGITQEPYSSNKYTLRKGPVIHDWSPTNETSWTLC